MEDKVFCIHMGARAHYIIPRSLEYENQLYGMITDTWIDSYIARFILSKLPFRITRSLSNRFVNDIPKERVFSFSYRFFWMEIWIRLNSKNYWNSILQRNKFFQNYALSIFKKLPKKSVVMGISYTSLMIFSEAKKGKQKIILFQIDPAEKEEIIVDKIVEQYRQKFPCNWKKAPRVYWNEWHKECFLADIIIVNSKWSATALIEQGIESKKIKIIPLPFHLESKHLQHKRTYPKKFEFQRPLRCLFLGTLNLRKGIHILLESAASLADYPIEFVLVGKAEIVTSLMQMSNVRYKGLATRAETDKFYKQADIFIFPTFSDGFGLTQLEAMAWQLPIIASQFCGDVVINGFNGITLEQCTVEDLTNALIHCLKNPEFLMQLSSNCYKTVEQFDLSRFSNEISSLQF